jgi:DNA topoisomerase-1
MVWKTLEHTGPSFHHDIRDVKDFLLKCYSDIKHIYKNDALFNSNFTKSLHDDVYNFKQSDTNNEFRCFVNNNVVSTGNNMSVESPHIFIGRGTHPLRGTCKYGVKPSDIIINHSSMSRYMSILKTKGFRKFVCKQECNWIACWVDSTTNVRRYMYLPKDINYEKFELARKLKQKIKWIHCAITADIVSPNPKRRQCALAAYLIEHLCIRVGNEKDGAIENETIGCCTLQKQHIKLLCNRNVKITFNGKDSIPFSKILMLPVPYYSELVSRLKTTNLLIFHDINSIYINNYLSNIIPNMSCKVFRTYKASVLFQKIYRNTSDIKSANMQVAILLNHKKQIKGKFVLNLKTSMNNYIDPRIYGNNDFIF